MAETIALGNFSPFSDSEIKGSRDGSKELSSGLKSGRSQLVLGAFVWLGRFFDLRNFLDGSLSLIKSLLPGESPAEYVYSHFLTAAT